MSDINGLNEGLLQPNNEPISQKRKEENQSDELSLSDIDLDLKKGDNFQSFLEELKNPKCCIKDMKKKWTILYSSLGSSIYLQNREFINNEKCISIFQIQSIKKIDVCKYCLEKCISSDLKKKKPREKTYLLSEISRIICECPTHRTQEKKENVELPGNVKMVNPTNFSEADKIFEEYERCNPNERRSWIRNKFDELSKNQANEDKIFEVYNAIFFKAVLQFFCEQKASIISSTIKYGEEIYNDYVIYEIKKLKKKWK